MYQLWNALPLHMPQSVVQSLQPCWLPCEAISVAPMSDTRGVYREHGHDQGEGVTCPWLGSIVTVTRSITHAAVVLPSDCPQHDRLGRSGTASLHLRFALLHQPYPCTRARRIQGPGERGRAELPEPAGGMDTEGEVRVLRQCCCWHAGHGVLLAVPDGRAKLHCSGTTPPPGHLGATAAEGECSRAAWWTLSDRHWREATKAMLHPDPPCRGGLCSRPAASGGTPGQAAAVGGEGGFHHDAPHDGQAAI
jgi:hypothetical protein